MIKLSKLTVLVFSLLIFPLHSIEISKDLKLLDLSKVNEESCRYSGRGALTMNNKFSEFVQGHSDALPADGASMFIEDNVAYLNNAFAGYGSDKEDNIFKKRIIELANSNSFKKIDWELVNGYDVNMKYGFEDWEFWINFLKDRGKVFRIPKVCFFYRIKESSRNVLISENDFDAIFDKFYQSTNQNIKKPVGSGLGLAICKQIMEYHKGKIWAEPSANGASIVFTLPINNTIENLKGVIIPLLLTLIAIYGVSEVKQLIEDTKNL